MRNDGEIICRSVQKGKQVTKRRHPQAAFGIIRAREQDFSNGIIGPIAGATLEPRHTAYQRPSKDSCEDLPTDSLQQINSDDRATSDTSVPRLWWAPPCIAHSQSPIRMIANENSLITSLGFCFAFFGLDERYGDFAPATEMQASRSTGVEL